MLVITMHRRGAAPCFVVLAVLLLLSAPVASLSIESLCRAFEGNASEVPYWWVPTSEAVASNAGAEVFVFDEMFVVLRNGFLCGGFDLRRPSLLFLGADFLGAGKIGANVLMSTGVSLVSVDSGGGEHSSADTGEGCYSASSGAGRPSVVSAQNASALLSGAAVVVLSGVADRCGSRATITEQWTLSLSNRSRALRLSIAGRTTKNVTAGTLSAVLHRGLMSGSSIYGLLSRGVVQMRQNDDPAALRYMTLDDAPRVYALGGCCSALHDAGNVCLSVVRSGGGIGDVPNVTSTFFELSGGAMAVALLSADGLIQPYYSGFEEYVILNTSTASKFTLQRDTWSSFIIAADPVSVDVPAGTSWTTTWVLGPNNKDFPTLPGTLLPVADDVGEEPSPAPAMAADDTHTLLTGIFASPVGNLFTHDNEVAAGYRVGQMATTIHRPSVGYSGTYNYFDPDNYFSTFALLSSYDTYLHSEVRRVLERSGAFLNERGQLPHHFVGVQPVYQALSGAIQTGPNVFWILSCFNYAKFSGDLQWLRGYMPRLRNASSFLFDMIDPDRQLLSAPGSLYIDVFIRNNFTSDSNAMLVGFFNEFADAEEFVGNMSGAAALRALSAAIAAAMNAELAAASGDHYITQRNPDGTIRDFVDYDSNLIALAHGVPNSTDFAQRIMARVDGGRCTHGRATFVSERYYGPDDCVNGNIGDSWCSMGRNGWFDALTRHRYDDSATFYDLIVDPIAADLRRWTWLWERYSCDGTPQLNRTWAYFEYPSVAVAMTSYVQYGVQPGLGAFTVNPFQRGSRRGMAVAPFTYRMSSVLIQWGVAAQGGVDVVVLTLRLPAVTDMTAPNTSGICDRCATRSLTLKRLPPNAEVQLMLPLGDCNVTYSGGASAVRLGTTDDSGVLASIDVPVADAAGVLCVLKITATPASSSAGGSSASSSSGNTPGDKRIQLIAGSSIGAACGAVIVGLVVRWRLKSSRIANKHQSKEAQEPALTAGANSLPSAVNDETDEYSRLIDGST